jgi:hypothetical protein
VKNKGLRTGSFLIFRRRKSTRKFFNNLNDNSFDIQDPFIVEEDEFRSARSRSMAAEKYRVEKRPRSFA